MGSLMLRQGPQSCPAALSFESHQFLLFVKINLGTFFHEPRAAHWKFLLSSCSVAKYQWLSDCLVSSFVLVGILCISHLSEIQHHDFSDRWRNVSLVNQFSYKTGKGFGFGLGFGVFFFFSEWQLHFWLNNSDRYLKVVPNLFFFSYSAPALHR